MREGEDLAIAWVFATGSAVVAVVALAYRPVVALVAYGAVVAVVALAD